MDESREEQEASSWTRRQDPRNLARSAAQVDLGAVERLVRRAIDERRTDDLDIVGYGEFSLAIRWSAPVGDDVVVKRVPPFRSSFDADEYVRVTEEYIAALHGTDVPCLPTELRQLGREDGAVVVFHIQPCLRPQELVSNILRAGSPDDAHPALVAVIAAIGRAVRPGVAFDGQCSNWGWLDGDLRYLDLSTPMLLGDDGDLQFAQDGFAREYPVIVRRLLDREARKFVPKYTELDFVLNDFVALLHRDRLSQWCDAAIEAIRRIHGIDISAETARSNFRSDARLYPFVHRLRLLQRFWLQRTGRQYESLLPATSSYTV
mgnify:CR=1 FL=1